MGFFGGFVFFGFGRGFFCLVSFLWVFVWLLLLLFFGGVVVFVLFFLQFSAGSVPQLKEIG